MPDQHELSNDDSASHTPTRSHQFLPIIDQIRSLHATKVCHGDIRLKNMNFTYSPVQDSKLVQVDISGRRKKKTYPKDYDQTAADAPRHAGAKPDKTLQYKHDWYALSKIMNFFETKQQKFIPLWKSAIKAVRSGAVDTEAISHLSKRAKIQIKDSKKELLKEFEIEIPCHPVESSTKLPEKKPKKKEKAKSGGNKLTGAKRKRDPFELKGLPKPKLTKFED